MSFTVYVKFKKSLKHQWSYYWDEYVQKHPWAIQYDHIFVQYSINFEKATDSQLNNFVEFLKEVEKVSQYSNEEFILGTHHDNGYFVNTIKFYELLKTHNLTYLDTKCSVTY